MLSHSTDEAFNDPSADIVVCSSDNVVLKLHKVILALASDFFKDMFGLPQPSSISLKVNDDGFGRADTVDELPAIRASEPSVVLNKLFRLCYPLDDPSLETIEEVRAVLTAALKYDLRKAIQIARRRLRELIPSASLRVYAIACKLSLAEEAQAAATAVREQMVQNTYVEELEEIPIGAYHRLLYYCSSPNFVPDPGFFCHGHGNRSESTKVNHPAATITSFAPSLSMKSATASLSVVTTYPTGADDTDVVVRSCDGAEFHLYRVILRHSSPVLWSQLLESPDAACVVITEPGYIISIILSIINPFAARDAPLTDLVEIHSALVAAKKYKMKKAIHYLEDVLVRERDKFSHDDALILYAVACYHDMRELALTAARYTLRKDLTSTLQPRLNDVDITAGYLFRLLDYRRRCVTAVRRIFDNTEWLNAEWADKLSHSCRRGYFTTKPCWYNSYMNSLSKIELPDSAAALQDDLLTNALVSMSGCHSCTTSRGGTNTLLAFARYAADSITHMEHQVKPGSFEPISFVYYYADLDGLRSQWSGR